MNIGGNKTKCLVTDLDGTLIHDFLTSEEIKQIYDKLVELSENIEIIINTARNLDSVADLFHTSFKHLERFCFITRFGEKIIMHGKELVDWSRFSDSILSPTNNQISLIKNIILESGYDLKRYNFINKFYINFKVNKPSLELINKINTELADENLELCYNQNNIKLISSKVNKGCALKYLQNILPKNLEYIGMGNGTLDNHFLKFCHKSYLINGNNSLNNCTFVPIRNREEHKRFMNLLLEILDR